MVASLQFPWPAAAFRCLLGGPCGLDGETFRFGTHALLWETGIDAHLARHVAHLFIRDPLVVFSESINQNDSVSNDHFEVCS